MENNQKEKPLILKVKDLENKIVATINNAGISAFIIKPIIEKILNQLNVLEQQEYVQAVENNKKEEKEYVKKDEKK